MVGFSRATTAGFRAATDYRTVEKGISRPGAVPIAGGEVPGKFSDVAVVSLLCVVRFGSGCWVGEFVGAMPHAPVVLGSPGNIRERQRRRRRINVRGEVQA
jgi:hypothetical protein